MPSQAIQHLIKELNQSAIAFDITNQQFYNTLLNKIADSSIVLLGESTHGSTEFYLTRMEISKRLIAEKNFNAILIEGDWTSTYHLHRFINGYENKNARQVLDIFKRFPTWMWANETMPSFLNWLRQYNMVKPSSEKIGFYGLDLYCLNEAMQAVVDYLNKVDPDAALAAKKRYECFDHVAVDPQTYSYLVDQGVKKACTNEVKQQLIAMQNLIVNQFHQEMEKNGDRYFYALQNAFLVKSAEECYRALFASRDVTWNLRDQHMADTVQRIKQHIEDKTKRPAKLIIWAHNSHVGDTRATEMADRDELNLGQLMRESYPNDCYLLGFSTSSGTVTAANDWGALPEMMDIQPPLASSYEELFHALDYKNFLLDLSAVKLQTLLQPSRLQRAIGVIYRPQSERMSHYFFTKLPLQFNAIIHLDKTSALIPLASEASTMI